MKLNLLLVTIFISVIIYAEINFESGHVGLTRLNGNGCLCHNPLNNDSVNVWIEGPDSLEVGQPAFYTININGGPSIKGGFNVAAFMGTLNPVDTTAQEIAGELTHTFPKLFGNASVTWHFGYTAPATPQWDTLYSVGNSVNGDGNPIPGDKWNFGANFPLKIIEKIVPVEFVSFNAAANGNTISLTWATATETNNYGFEVQRSTNNLFFSTIGFVKGNGTTTENNDYNFSDKITKQGVFSYRLKQIDFDGSFMYSEVIDINVKINTFSLEQNHPNPFNPVTIIKYAVNDLQFVSLKVYDVLGTEIVTLVNEEKPAGSYRVSFNAAQLSSGVYIYKLQTVSFAETKKMILLR